MLLAAESKRPNRRVNWWPLSTNSWRRILSENEDKGATNEKGQNTDVSFSDSVTRREREREQNRREREREIKEGNRGK